jgi:hypothetical protein
MSDTSYSVFQHYGTNAERLAFIPSPAVGIQPIYLWYETDTDNFYIYTTSWKGPYSVSGAGISFSDAETPSGSIDGVNSTFMLAHAPSPAASLVLVMNGITLREGAGNDYTLSGSTITMASAPETGTILLSWYRY